MQVTALYPYAFAGKFRTFTPKGVVAPAYNPDIELTLTINRTVDVVATVNRTVTNESELT